jgi:hypothetical protein
LNCLTVRLHTCVANHDHPSALPIRLVAISCQPPGAWRKPAAVTVAAGAEPVPGDRVAVSTTLKLLSVVTASHRALAQWIVSPSRR